MPSYPGDGGDWTAYTTFINQLITDFKAAGMTGKDVRWELWNEPDYSGFWKGTQAQWLEMWKRGYQQVRAALPDAVMEGPSTAGGVGGWFTAFLDYVKTSPVLARHFSERTSTSAGVQGLFVASLLGQGDASACGLADSSLGQNKISTLSTRGPDCLRHARHRSQGPCPREIVHRLKIEPVLRCLPKGAT